MSEPLTSGLIVAIDADRAVQDLLRSHLRDNYTVEIFDTVQGAASFISEHTPDLVLADYHMWRGGGSELAARTSLEQNTSAVPVILLLDESGADDEPDDYLYILKPLRPKKLKALVRLQFEAIVRRQNLEHLVNERTSELMSKYMHGRLREEATLDLLARVTDMRGYESATHLSRMAGFAGVMVEELQKGGHNGYTLSEMQAAHITKAVKLHDIGKISIPESILGKPGMLTDEEFETVKLHPVQGAALIDEYISYLGNDEFVAVVREIVLCHHEKWDGSGYPEGRKGEDIPLSGRITAIADIYDALTTARPYKTAFSHEQAVKVMQDNSGKYFDPYLIDVFMQVEKNFEALARTVQ